ncbi:3-ketodihydrosphingosine reductase tsc10 [Daldinia childiae]|uniref:3-ketodihydrosphingosine reductase tsc10 n=1 Tax=Daldinia childiae TaxID=326645 RepID=UPI0014477767|nr:3-ketodihydrosphingosine reductase tsc10 [Daldinia childiae]KAF3061091.1 3-ketodihydrosphingosine reductase tsc10 [Daldinia childiae]
MGSFLSRNEFPVQGRTVLITGGSRGLGLNAARQLAEKGANVIIVARNEAKLQEGARSPETQRFHYISADVTTSAECARVVTESIAWNHGAPPDVVWCCSGSAHATLYIDTPPEQFQTMMDSNYFSCAYMAHAVLNAWIRPNPDALSSEIRVESKSQLEIEAVSLPARHLVFTGSFVSLYSFAGFAPYSPSKAAIRALSDSLSQEMNLYAAAHPNIPRVRVHTVFPATMPTQGLEEENSLKTDLTKSLEEGDQILEPAEVARRAIRGLESGEDLVPTSTIIKLVMTSVLGGSTRGGFWKGLVNTLLGWIVLVVMVFIRWEMDTKVTKWGREHGSSGMLKEKGK